MKVQAEVSLCPLRTEKLSGPIAEFCQALRLPGLYVETRSMSTFVSGESETLFQALREGFEGLAHKTEIVVDLKISNACPARFEDEPATKERVE
jgi:uncharacterized protein YqgV (UPF0045/DUF77 family)